MANNSFITDSLELLGLTQDQTSIYISLLKGPKNRLEISRDTNIGRSNVYRLVDELIEIGVVHEITTQDDKLLESADPKTLELLVVNQETSAQQKRTILTQLLPALKELVNQDDGFAIRNYTGASGIKQMMWNELRTKSDICIFSCGSLDKATGKNFAEKFRMEIIVRNIMQRALENPESDNPTVSGHPGYQKHYDVRYIDRNILNIMPEITIHDETVSIYNNWENNVQIGTEIKSPFFAVFMRQVFESYWKMAQNTKK